MQNNIEATRGRIVKISIPCAFPNYGLETLRGALRDEFRLLEPAVWEWPLADSEPLDF